MNEQFLKDEAIVLAVRNRGDYDAVVSCITKENGRLAFFSKGLRRGGSKMRAFLQNYQGVQLELLQGKGNLPRLIGAEPTYMVLRPYTLDELTHFAYWAELTQRFLEEDTPEESVYMLWRESIEAVDKVDMHLLSFYFQLNLLDILGYGLRLDVCSICGQNFTKEAGAVFSLEGQAIHHACAQSQGMAFTDIGLEAEAVLKKIHTSTAVELAPLRISSKAKGFLWKLFDSCIAYHLGYVPNERIYLQKMPEEIDKLL